MPSTTTDRLYGLTTSVFGKAPCRVATTAAITLSGEQAIDGVAVVTDDRVLVKNQTDTTENGIYICETGDWVRAADFNGSLDTVTGTMIEVNFGTTNAETFWRCTSTGVIVIGTDAITFEEIEMGPDTRFTVLTVHLAYAGTPSAQGWMGGVGLKDDVTFPADFVGSLCTVKTNPASSYVITIKVAGATVGTITISTAGAATFASTGGATVAGVENDQVDFYGPDVAGTAADFTITLIGEVE